VLAAGQNFFARLFCNCWLSDNRNETITVSELLLLTSSYSVQQEGQAAAGGYVRDLVDALSRRISVTVVAPSENGDSSSHGNLHHELFRFGHLPVSLLRPSRIDHWMPIGQLLATGFSRTRGALERREYKHILALWTLPAGLWARCVQRCGVPYSVWALGSDIWDLAKLPLGQGLNRWIVRSAFKVYADGVRLSEDISAFSERECTFLPTARSLNLSAEAGPKLVPPLRMAYLGRWHLNKGVDLLLDSLDRLSDSDWGCIEEIRIYGGGPLEPIVTARIAGFQQSGRPVVGGGYLNKVAARELLRWSDWLFIPSRIESIPVVFSDAVQAGCGVISMPAGDLPSLISRYKVGVCATELSAGAYFKAIKEVLAGNVETSRAGYQQARDEFDLAKTAERLISDLQLN
jgi:glycosyltransferase involved in cell wall biosynthesis